MRKPSTSDIRDAVLSRRAISFIAAFVAVALAAGIGLGQFRDDRDYSAPVATWEIDRDFAHDVFTFARVRYRSYGRERRGDGWQTDYPDSDLNFSYRLQQLTSLEVNPTPKVVNLTDEELFDHPFIYIVEPVQLYFEDDEVAALRRYLLNGGFLMVDDLWGDDQFEHIHRELKKIFHDRDWVELPLDHEIFHCVYDLDRKPQVPSIHAAQRGRSQGITWQGGDDARIPHYRAFFDDHDRMVTLICHNTDIGDGWEREGEEEWYFREFSEKQSYPMGINIVVYALTH